MDGGAEGLFTQGVWRIAGCFEWIYLQAGQSVLVVNGIKVAVHVSVQQVQYIVW